ncbi:hypothetical protein M758_6G158200 [Ceratodon purpureus]|nr:hypothetical protein M758_6G158200 [Ceratodon purpureus]
MDTAVQKCIKAIRNKNFDKLVAVANPALGESFEKEINYHYSYFPLADMTLDRLHKIATTNVPSDHKTKWLQWWNATLAVRKSVRFPEDRPMKDKTLDTWLHVASLWAQLERYLVDEVERLVATHNLHIDWKDEFLKPIQYVEKWRVPLWKKAYGYLLGANASPRFHKGSDLLKIEGGKMAGNRLVYRYFRNELVHKGALGVWAMPKQFEDVALLESQPTIFTADQQDRFDNHLLLTGAWFLECERNIVHQEEAYLVPPPSPSAIGGTQLHLEVEGLELEDEPPASVSPVAQTRGRGVRGTKRKNKKNHPPAPPLQDGNNDNIDVPQDLGQTGGNASVPTATKTQGVAAEILSQVSKGLSAGKVGANSSQASEGGVFNACSRPSFKLDGDSAQSPHQGGQARIVTRPIPMPKTIPSSSSSPEIPTLPMYLERGNPVEMVCESNHKSTWVPQIMDIVQHIHQIGQGRRFPVTAMEFSPKHPGIDLIIADAPEGLPVPVISEQEVPSWNVREKDYVENLFYFASYHLTDVGCILLMHAKDRKIERVLDDRSRAYDFRVVRDWWGYNPLPMASTLPHKKFTHNFNIKVYARKSVGVKFRTRQLNKEYAGVNIVPDEQDDLCNFTDKISQLLRPDGTPWRGSREKDPSFIQSFVDLLTDEGDIVFDWSASTGASVIACARSNRHLIALERDHEIFEGVLAAYKNKPVVKEYSGESQFDSDSDSPPPKKGRIYMGLKQRLSVNSELYKSPPSTFSLPSYAEGIAQQFTRASSPAIDDSSRYRYSNRVFRFLDIEADQCDHPLSDDYPPT